MATSGRKQLKPKFGAKKEQKLLTKKNTVYFLILVAVLGVVGYLLYSGTVQSIFENPLAQQQIWQNIKPPSAEVPLGLASIRVYDPVNETYFNTIMGLYFDSNESFMCNVSTDSTFKLNESTWVVLNITGYHPQAMPVEGSGSDTGSPHINTYYLYRIASNKTLSFRLLSIDGNYSANNISRDLGNGTHTLEFSIINNNYTQNYTVFGWASWLPNGTYLEKDYTKNLDIKGTGSWMRWNGTIGNITILMTGSSNPIYPSIYQLNHDYNVSWGPPVFHRAQFTLQADFLGVNNVSLYQGWIDDYNMGLVDLM